MLRISNVAAFDRISSWTIGTTSDLRQQHAVAHDVQDLGLREEQDAAHALLQPFAGTSATLAASSTSAIAARISVSRQR